MAEEKKKKMDTLEKESVIEKPKSSGVGLFFIWFFVLLICICSTAIVVGGYVHRNHTKLTGILNKYLNISVNNERTEEKENESKKPLVVNENEKKTIDIVEQSMPSVVSIALSKVTLSQRNGIVDESSKIGTGFIVDPSGIVVTNQHVVSGVATGYKIITSDGDEHDVEQILKDDLYDIAVLKVNTGGKNFKAIELGDSSNLKVGQSVIAIGTPLGEYSGTVTTGIISGLDRRVTASSNSGWFNTTSKTYEGVVQTDAAINSGNSGGPLINSQGQVIGINFATTATADNISFSIPINKVKSRLEEYRTYGKFIKPYLGISYQMIGKYEALLYSAPNIVPGALVKEVDGNAPAYKAGIRRADIITKFGGKDVEVSLSDMIQSRKVGEEVEIEVNRGGEKLAFKVKLSESNQ